MQGLQQYHNLITLNINLSILNKAIQSLMLTVAQLAIIGCSSLQRQKPFAKPRELAFWRVGYREADLRQRQVLLLWRSMLCQTNMEPEKGSFLDYCLL